MSSSKKFSVAICGGGVAGLTTAVSLSKYPEIDVHIYEASSQLGEFGAGLGMWKRTWNIMECLGVSEDLATMFESVPTEELRPVFRFRKSDVPTGGVEFFHLVVPFGQLTFHRVDFQRILTRHCENVQIHFDKKLVSYTQEPTSSVRVDFEDGSTALCNVLVGADGIHSKTRQLMLDELLASSHKFNCLSVEELRDPFWTGTIAYRGIFAKEVLDKVQPDHRAGTGPFMWCGKNKHIVSFLVSQGTLINVVAFCSSPDKEGEIYSDPWAIQVTQEELLDQYQGWEPDAVSLLKCIEKPTRWAVHALHPLPTYSVGRVALVGDAAHAMTPHQGSGAGQSIEDSFILSSLLANPATTLQTLPEALTVYDELRRPLAEMVLRRSRLNGLVYEFNTPEYDGRPLSSEADLADLKASAEQLRELWGWAWSGHPADDKDRAGHMLDALIDRGRPL